MNSVGQARPRADGFPLAPLIEALLDVRFELSLTDAEVEGAVAALGRAYPEFARVPFHDIRVDAEAGSVEVAAPRMHYRGQGSDSSEIALVRPDGFAASQLAPYRDWKELYGRFTRDLSIIFEAIGTRPLSRMAVRSINRIDIAPQDNLIRYEDYLTVYPHLPAELDPIEDFQVQILRNFPQAKAAARIAVRGHPNVVAGHDSFIVDVDLFRAVDVPDFGSPLDAVFDEFRQVKNSIYKTCLTPLALEEFEQ